MQDRVPTYPGRVQLTPVPGQANKYDMVRADEPTQEGTPLNKENLLSDNTCNILGIPTTSSVSYAIMTSYLQASGKAAVEIHCILPNGQPASYAKVSGLSGATNTVANVYGVLTTLANIGSTTLSIAGFLDLNGTSKAVNLQAGLTVVTLESTQKTATNMSLTSSLTAVAFSGMVDTFDVFCVGGGGAGGGGSYQKAGGAGGRTNSLLNVSANPSTRTDAIVGAGGVGGGSGGATGGITSIFACAANGGGGGVDGSGGSGGSGGGGVSSAGGSNGSNGAGGSGGSGQGTTTRAFGEAGGELYSGGGGGSSGAGGAGGGGSGSTGGAKGGNGEAGKGGGGGGGFNSDGGNGGSGIILLRWRWKA